MATRFYLRELASQLGGAQQIASPRMGRNVASQSTATTAGGTNIPLAITWFSDPITAAVTISGTVTVNVWGFEAANTVNAGAGILIERTNNAGTVQSTIVAVTGVPATITEYTTAPTVKTGTYTPTSTNMAVGERIKFTVSVRNVGTMGANATGVTNGYAGPTAGANGDAYIEFTENFVVDLTQDVGPFEIVGSGYYG